MAAFVCLATCSLWAQEPRVHYMYPQGLPPGAIGGQQLQRGGPLPGYFQPVEIRAPQGVQISLAEGGRFSDPQKTPLRVGLLVGHVYRFAAVNVPLRAGVAVFPTIEMINRLYTPRGQELRFPVVIELTQEDLELAVQGKFVTRVVYLEDPNQALPARQDKEHQTWFDVGAGQDPLAAADAMGRPMAIVRLGGRVPEQQDAPDATFLFGCPPVMRLAPCPDAAPATTQRNAATTTAAKPAGSQGRTTR